MDRARRRPRAQLTWPTPRSRPLGLFGGTFDPIHFGHLRLATELAEAFHLEKVIFVPAGLPYHRGRAAHATSEQRLTMLKLATARDARFDVDDRELRRERPHLHLRHPRRDSARSAARTLPLVFLTGSDAFAKIDTWHRWTELFELAHFVVAIRANDEKWHSKGPGAFPTRGLAAHHPQPARAAGGARRQDHDLFR